MKREDLLKHLRLSGRYLKREDRNFLLTSPPLWSIDGGTCGIQTRRRIERMYQVVGMLPLLGLLLLVLRSCPLPVRSD